MNVNRQMLFFAAAYWREPAISIWRKQYTSVHGRAGTRPSPPGIGGVTAGPMAAATSRYRVRKECKLKNGSQFTRSDIRQDIALKKTRDHNEATV
jgi:hypothetical protein